MTDHLTILTFAAVLGSGLVAGIFFAFSTFVMRALARIPTEQGIAAMQAINVSVLNPWFLGVFFGTGVVCVPIALLVLSGAAGPHPSLLLAGCVLYVAGSILVTVAGNVPLNDQLAAVDARRTEASALWRLYLIRWTRWNHVRTASSLAAAALFAAALRA